MTRPAAGTSSLPWAEHPGHPQWASSRVTDLILGVDEAGRGHPIPKAWTHQCARRIAELRDVLRSLWVGLDLGERGHLTDWVLALLIARESGLLLGSPGTAKTEIAEQTFALLGLVPPRHKDLPEVPTDGDKVHEWWERRERQERETQKYFSFVLNRFTEPEEIFGPIDISLLRRGVLVRVNFGMLTGPGMRAAFLDEVFKASSSILNTMLRLILNREHFNWGGMRSSDLLMFLAASNELPGGLASGHVGVGASGDDFATLYAFLDRFPVRLDVPLASGTSTEKRPHESALAVATQKARMREASKFTTGRPFAEPRWKDRPCLNDLLLLGRAMLHQGSDASTVFEPTALTNIDTRFFTIASRLQLDGTSVQQGRITWTISPRKLKALWKVMLAYALVRDDGFGREERPVVDPLRTDLHVFDWIWDTPLERDELATRVQDFIHA